MHSVTIRCKKCNGTLIVQGKPGEKFYITCPNCGCKGMFMFPIVEAIEIDSPESYAIEVDGLTKTYRGFTAVNKISFRVKTGEIFGFLGPNGAGKTTTMKSILDIIHADVGNIKIKGIDIRTHGKEARKLIGYMPEKVAFYDHLTALQNLSFYAEMRHIPTEDCRALIDIVGLGDTGKKPVGKFSKGMVQRLGMARAILGNPEILILDEPSSGLDPRGIALFRDIILDMKKKGAAIFLSSHILSEIQSVCDRVGIINKGVLVAQDEVSALSKKLQLMPQIIIDLETITDTIDDILKKIPGVTNVEIHGKQIIITCDSKTKTQVILAIEGAGCSIINIQTREPSLEEVFMRYTGG